MDKTSTTKIDYSFSSLIGANIPYRLGDDNFRCPHCKENQLGHRWINLAGMCMHCGNCWSDVFLRDRDGLLKNYNDPCLELLFTSVAEELAKNSEEGNTPATTINLKYALPDTLVTSETA